MEKYCFLADDLTGAMDTGVKLTKKGTACEVIPGFDLNFSHDRNILTIVNTQTRNMSACLAAQKYRALLKSLKETGQKIIYKKIDSTLRGNIGAELDMIMDHYEYDIAIIAPALPDAGRITINGIHYVEGIEIKDTDIGRDPFSPVIHSYIPYLIASQSNKKVMLIDHTILDRAVSDIVIFIKGCMEKGASYIVSDILNDIHLEKLAEAIIKLPGKILPCGSAGLFDKLKKPVTSKLTESNLSSVGPVLVISATPSLVSKNQIEYVRKNDTSVYVYDLNHHILNNDSYEIEKMIRSAVVKMEDGHDIVLDAGGWGKEYILKNSTKEKAFSDSDVLRESVSNIALAFLKDGFTGTLVIFGGDTAYSILEKLKAPSILLKKEILPLVALGEIPGSKLHGINIVTKAGGFGNERCLADILEILRYGGK